MSDGPLADTETLEHKRWHDEDKKRQLEDDVRWLMRQLQGRRVMWWLLEESGLFRVSFTGERLSTDFNEGRRSIGVALHEQLLRVARPEAVHMATEAWGHEGEVPSKIEDSEE